MLQRRAQPLLGTLVEVGLRAECGATAAGLGGDGEEPVDGALNAALNAALDAACNAALNAALNAAFTAAFKALHEAQAAMSRFDPRSDIARFNALPRGGRLQPRRPTLQVLQAAAELQAESDGCFDISLGRAPAGWALDGDSLVKLHAAAQLDLGGIGKGHAVDLAVQALQSAGCSAGWVNAGGDLRAFGDLATPVLLRCESQGGVRHFADLQDGAFATSAFGGRHRSRLAGAPDAARHVSVAAPTCLWADALTKVVAARGDIAHPLLARHGAQAWLH